MASWELSLSTLIQRIIFLLWFPRTFWYILILFFPFTYSIIYLSIYCYILSQDLQLKYTPRIDWNILIIWVNKNEINLSRCACYKRALNSCLNSWSIQPSVFMHTWNAGSSMGVPDIRIAKKIESDYRRVFIFTGFMF